MCDNVCQTQEPTYMIESLQLEDLYVEDLLQCDASAIEGEGCYFA